MSPESFNFTVTVPGDARLVGVVRDLCTHAVGYARLPEAAGVAVAALLQYWKRNTLLSVFAATACYMALIRLL